MEYVPEQADFDDGMDEEFRKIFEKFTFRETAGTQVRIFFALNAI